jgi:hypothetical protein
MRDFTNKIIQLKFAPKTFIMKKLIYTIAMVLFISFPLQGQIADPDEREVPEDGWNFGGMFSLGFSQVSLSNWTAGGESSVAGNGLTSIFADFGRDNLTWNNSLDLGYGLQRREGERARKTDDRIELLSKLGLEATENWNYSGLVNFRTQMAPGYDYPNVEVPISNFMAPAYLLAALGMDYQPFENFSVFISPVTGKATFVLDQDLADLGAFGVDPGNNLRYELGAYLRADYRVNITEDIMFRTKLDLFSNYLDKPQNLDVNWETRLNINLTRYISASFGTHLIYDEDATIITTDPDTGEPEILGPRVQFKQLLTVGLSYSF